jgi:hypothetical protein
VREAVLKDIDALELDAALSAPDRSRPTVGGIKMPPMLP